MTSAAHGEAERAVRQAALALPEAWEDAPWGYPAFKVRKRVFVFLSVGEEGFAVSVKLPETGEVALTMDGTAPTGYGLGRSGWVSARYPPGTEVPLDVVLDWVEESYRAVAPKTLVKRLG